MNPRDLLLLSLRRQELDYQMRAREALIHVEEALRKNEQQFAKQLINEFVFCEKTKSGRINTTQEALLVVVLLSDHFIKDDPSKIPFFFSIFDVNKNSRKFLLLKFILTGIATQSRPALNAAGTYLLDPLTKDFRIAADFGRLLINEISFFANNSIEKMKTLSVLSPLLVNAMCLVFAETFKDDLLPTPIIGRLATEFMSCPSPPFIFTFAITQHLETGAAILTSIFRWTVLSELFEEKPSYSLLHLQVLECINNVDLKLIVYTKHLEPIIDQLLRAAKIKEPERVQQSLEKFAQLIQVSKMFLYGNIPHFIERLKLLPRNSLLELVITSVT